MKLYQHFTLTERESLAVKIKEGKSNNQIAKEMGRHRSTIGREIKRNYSKKAAHYNAWHGTCLYIERRHKCVRKPVIQHGTDLYNYLLECLSECWPPETIAHKCHQKGFDVAMTTIYSAVRNGAFDGITAKTHLRRRNKNIKHNRKSTATIKPQHTIHERPAEVEERSRYGDYEGDTVLGAVGKGALSTMVDRKSRYLIAGISADKTAESVRNAIKRSFELSAIRLEPKTITLDNGSEFAQFKGIEDDLKTTIYFADPHSPWQRGTNENTNDILRFYFPKGTDFTKVSLSEVQAVVNSINNRPRKCLGYLSPFEVLSSKCCT